MKNAKQLNGDTQILIGAYVLDAGELVPIISGIRPTEENFKVFTVPFEEPREVKILTLEDLRKNKEGDFVCEKGIIFAEDMARYLKEFLDEMVKPFEEFEEIM